MRCAVSCARVLVAAVGGSRARIERVDVVRTTRLSGVMFCVLALFAAFVGMRPVAAAVTDEPIAARVSNATREEELPRKTALVAALSAPVEIELDRVEIPTIRAQSLEDAVAAQGWIHARERFLQMDLARREAAGELGELVPAAVALDRATRVLGLRAVADRALGELPVSHRTLLERYCDGVNAQLAAGAPVEYRLLKVQPKPWTPADCVLVQLGMARYLDGSARQDRSRAALWSAFPPEVARFLSSSSGALDMSIDGSPLPAPLELPGTGALDLRTSAKSAPSAATPQAFDARPQPTLAADARVHPGSNAFAVAGTRTKDGRAIVANDMHLALMAPGIWYRVAIEWGDAPARRTLVGLSLPGVPLVVQGTNGHVAWGFTNLTADLSDVVLVERDPANAARYLVDGGSEAFGEFRETLAGGEELTRRTTRWGPVVETLPDGRLVVVRCATFEPRGIDFGLFELATTTTLEQSLDAVRRWRGPPQNALFADANGRIGWTIAGTLPARGGDHPTPVPLSWRDLPSWSGALAADAKPAIVDPPSGILTSGNQLSLAPTVALRAVLGLDEAGGDRAYRLREILSTRSDWTEPELHAVQLDVRSPRLVRWRDAIIAALPEHHTTGATDSPMPPPAESSERSTATPSGDAAAHGSMNRGTSPKGSAAASALAAPPTSRDAHAAIVAWDGEVTAAATAPVVLDAFRQEFRADFARALAARAPAAADASELEGAIDDEALLRVLEARPEHLCPGADGWSALVGVCLERATGRATEPDNTLATRGARNRAAIRHPAADSLGAAARMAEMPRTPLPGHPTCVRVQTPQFGASERSVVSPGRLAEAILVTPCGQSGMPMSPHFRSLHRPWQDGTPYPLLPGDGASRIDLVRELPAPPPAAGEGK